MVRSTGWLTIGGVTVARKKWREASVCCHRFSTESSAHLAACIAVAAVNPNGLTLVTYPFQTLGSYAMQTLIQEWQPPDLSQRALLPYVAFLILLAFALIAARPRLGTPSVILLVAFSIASLQTARWVSIGR